MRTSKAFSTISYNSDSMLEGVLGRMVERGIVSFWCYINHHPEDDQTKIHKHVYVVPSRLVDTASFINEFLELDIAHPDKPLRCLPCQSSKFADWYLYALHDPEYLARKGKQRKYHYTRDDVVSSDNDFLIHLIHEIDFSSYERDRLFRELVDRGFTFESIVDKGFLIPAQIRAYQTYYACMLAARSRSTPYRNADLARCADSDGVLPDLPEEYVHYDLDPSLIRRYELGYEPAPYFDN